MNLLHPKILCAKFGWNWLNGSGEEIFFNFVNVFSLFCNCLPLKKGGALHLHKLESPSPMDALYQVFFRNWPSGSGEENFKILSMYFHYFVIISPWKRPGPFIWINLNPLYPGILYAKFGWNWPRVLEKILKSCHFFLLFPNYLPFRSGVALRLNKNAPLSPRDTLCQVWLKLAQWFWRRR